jgi:hypothetical protein
MWKERIYVPINPTLRERAIRWCHDEPMAGHPGIAKTLELTTRTFWWPNMKKDIEKYIKACHKCQVSKPDRHVRKVAVQDIGLSELENTHGVVIVEIFWSWGSTIRVIQRIRLYEP